MITSCLTARKASDVKFFNSLRFEFIFSTPFFASAEFFIRIFGPTANLTHYRAALPFGNRLKYFRGSF